jgi:putative transposase
MLCPAPPAPLAPPAPHARAAPAAPAPSRSSAASAAHLGRRAARRSPQAHRPHARRAPHAADARAPSPITLRARANAPSLRSDLAFGIVRRAVARLSHEDGRTFTVVHFSVQRDHVHLLVEAHDKKALSRGARRLVIGIVKRLNAPTGQKGPLWGDRYHRRDLHTPREVRNALVYVLTNLKKHAPELRAYDDHDARRGDSGVIDTRSSAPFFQGWDRGPPPMNARRPNTSPVATAPWSWLLAQGWKRHGLVSWTAAPARGARPAPAPAGQRRAERRSRRIDRRSDRRGHPTADARTRTRGAHLDARRDRLSSGASPEAEGRWASRVRVAPPSAAGRHPLAGAARMV